MTKSKENDKKGLKQLQLNKLQRAQFIVFAIRLHVLLDELFLGI